MVDVRFARSPAGSEVAYAEIGGAGPGIVHLTYGTDPVEVQLDDPPYRKFLLGLCELGRVVSFDRRGVGMSDPPDWDRSLAEQGAEDVLAVMDAARMETATLVVTTELGLGLLAAHQAPDRITRLIVLSPPGLYASQADPAANARMVADVHGAIQERGAFAYFQAMFPERADDPVFVQWWERAGRLGASAADNESLTRARARDLALVDHSALMPSAPPVLLLHRDTGIRGFVDEEQLHDIHTRLPGSTLVALPGTGFGVNACDPTPVLRAISEFLTGEVRVRGQRRLAAVLMTDIVGSTRRLAADGDDDWHTLLDRHDHAVRAAVMAHGGRVVKLTGDGVLSIFESGTLAVEAALAMQEATAALGLRTRTGIHVGEVELRGDDLTGIAVHLAARAMGTAEQGGIVVSAATAHTTLGGPHAYASLGQHELKGVPGLHELYSVTADTSTRTTTGHAPACGVTSPREVTDPAALPTSSGPCDDASA